MDEPPKQTIGTPELVRILLENQNEANIYIRHYEETRFKITQMTIALSGLLIGALRFGDTQVTSGTLFGVFIVILGMLGAAVSAKYTERASRHIDLARMYRGLISTLVGNVDGQLIETIRAETIEKHRKSAPLLSAVRARYFWIGIHLFLIVFGIIIVIKT